MEMLIDEAITWLNTDDYESKGFADATSVAINTMHKYQQLEDFAKWVAEEVIDDDMWALNHLAFAEIACRKLVQLGIMQESDGEYSYEVVEDGK